MIKYAIVVGVSAFYIKLKDEAMMRDDPGWDLLFGMLNFSQSD